MKYKKKPLLCLIHLIENVILIIDKEIHVVRHVINSYLKLDLMASKVGRQHKNLYLKLDLTASKVGEQHKNLNLIKYLTVLIV
ncbi:hypothetical protein BCAMP_12768 [Brochothrix campestris FSL F6-1037]|uniref:Uncharacterized protein n=1 Tax=Brochothrix campestris FSL F6-1037 TaxID=1265861 RepID=W7CLY5_9LIST|nr:hypothetical protein BCAMP_12768 [Brochothrix campestris FSL F6-1037]